MHFQWANKGLLLIHNYAIKNLRAITFMLLSVGLRIIEQPMVLERFLRSKKNPGSMAGVRVMENILRFTATAGEPTVVAD